MSMTSQLDALRQQLSGELHYDKLLRVLYATDASIYRELPLAVAFPKDNGDIKKLITFATAQGTSLIPRAAGTSLAGQCVGDGIVMDIGRHMNQILELNAAEGWVRVQPGVIRDELNDFLRPHGLFFGPNTSTANRCMIGGMVGNNSCGTTSIVYGSTRDHVLELDVILSDGSEVRFAALDQTAFAKKLEGDSLENKVYQQVSGLLSQNEIQQEIRKEFPKASIHRRNTGYAVDILLDMLPFSENGQAFNFCKLLTGSEGTLAVTTAIKLHVDPLPPAYSVLVASHFTSIQESLEAVLVAMQHQPMACEHMDKAILDCSKGNIEQEKNRFFIDGDPAAVLMTEVGAGSAEEAEAKADALIAAMRDAGFGYSHPKVKPPQIKRVWDLRKAGLGILSNIPGDAKPVACIEDTAVDVNDLPIAIHHVAKLRDVGGKVVDIDGSVFNTGDMMDGYGQQAIYYAHAGAGELHLRPILNLKTQQGVSDLKNITEDTARLVKKYQGSLSGEHGDGRVRAEFIPIMIGAKNYELLRQIKQQWDPNNIFNPGKIVDTPPMETSLRYEPNQQVPPVKTKYHFPEEGGILGLAEKCNGSGDCRRILPGATMCPSYRATRNEKDSTRARANAMREFLTRENDGQNPFDHEELKEVLDLCLSCKACTAECPSSVDMTTMKSEFLYQYYQQHGVPLRARAFANINRLNKLGSILPKLSNFMLSNALSGGAVKKILGVAPQRSLPTIHPQSLRDWYRNWKNDNDTLTSSAKTVYFFCDEFTDYNDTPIGSKAIELLTRLGYQVEMIEHEESGRAAMSKGLLDIAQQYARTNVAIFSNYITAETPLIGIEPSAILSFRDEYLRLVDADQLAAAKALSNNVFTIDEFLAAEIKAGRIEATHFTKVAKKIKLHGHCHQKALSSIDATAWMLSLPENYEVELIPSGCCGMAGSFGYEAEHYELSMQIGELVLFPAVRESAADIIIAAPGTSCRHQIKDGTERKALHPVEILYEALV